MKGGYAGKMLFVDLSKGKIETRELTEDVAHRFVGTYGIGARVLYDMMKPGVDPLAHPQGQEIPFGFPHIDPGEEPALPPPEEAPPRGIEPPQLSMVASMNSRSSRFSGAPTSVLSRARSALASSAFSRPSTAYSRRG